MPITFLPLKGVKWDANFRALPSPLLQHDDSKVSYPHYLIARVIRDINDHTIDPLNTPPKQYTTERAGGEKGFHFQLVFSI